MIRNQKPLNNSLDSINNFIKHELQPVEEVTNNKDF